MENSVDIPTLPEAELLKRANAFADDLTTNLRKFNEQHPWPKMSEQAWQYFKTEHNSKVPGPIPEQLTGAFRNRFCRYMQSHYGIIP
jgi:hypothetical protein